MARLLAQPKGPGPLVLRDRALLELMYACGLRASEACELKLSDVDLQEGLLCARGKGSKERLVPIGRQALSALRVYCASARPLLIGNEVQPKLFVNHRGAGLTRQGLYKIVQGHARTAGLSERMSPAHAPPHLRHASSGGGLRSAILAGDARPRGSGDHAGLHAPVGRPPQGRLLRGASPGEQVRDPGVRRPRLDIGR